MKFQYLAALKNWFKGRLIDNSKNIPGRTVENEIISRTLILFNLDPKHKDKIEDMNL